MLTAEDLRAAIEWYASERAFLATQELAPRLPVVEAHECIDTLLSFVRAVADIDPFDLADAPGCCRFCEGTNGIGTGHADDCLWAAAQGVKP